VRQRVTRLPGKSGGASTYIFSLFQKEKTTLPSSSPLSGVQWERCSSRTGKLQGKFERISILKRKGRSSSCRGVQFSRRGRGGGGRPPAREIKKRKKRAVCYAKWRPQRGEKGRKSSGTENRFPSEEPHICASLLLGLLKEGKLDHEKKAVLAISRRKKAGWKGGREKYMSRLRRKKIGRIPDMLGGEEVRVRGGRGRFLFLAKRGIGSISFPLSRRSSCADYEGEKKKKEGFPSLLEGSLPAA